MKRFKALLFAYACESGKGSEPGVGWSIALLGRQRELLDAIYADVIRGFSRDAHLGP